MTRDFDGQGEAELMAREGLSTPSVMPAGKWTRPETKEFLRKLSGFGTRFRVENTGGESYQEFSLLVEGGEDGWRVIAKTTDDIQKKFCMKWLGAIEISPICSSNWIF